MANRLRRGGVVFPDTPTAIRHARTVALAGARPPEPAPAGTTGR